MAPALLTAVDATRHVHLVVGSNSIAAARCTRSLEVGATVKVVAPAESELHHTLAQEIEQKRVVWVQEAFNEAHLKTLGREEVENVVDAVFVTLRGQKALCTQISSLCRRLRIPVNVLDAPELCTFTLLAHYTDGPLQIGVTTSGRGCKLASRIRREIVAKLPGNLGRAVDRMGVLRRRLAEEDHTAEMTADVDVDEDDTGQTYTFNRLVQPEDAEAAKSRRIRWLSQICEYWPLTSLVSATDEEIELLLQSYAASNKSGSIPCKADARRRRGRIILAGSGPGHPDLLTRATFKAIKSADLVLADKLVPGPVMDLVPRRAEVHIAKKFPGNADRAQEELLERGLEGLEAGKVVVRIKQGDPYIYGRGAEEYHFFQSQGYEPLVLPGVTSALSAPLFAQIPPTHRGVADEVLICTGVGRKGAPPDPPAYANTRTVVFLMALNRLSDLVQSLICEAKQWPKETPCAVIERASCPDQRVIRTTLEWVCTAVEKEGSRPPGLLVVGKSCEVLIQTQEKYVVEDGFKGLDELDLPMAEPAAMAELA